MQHFICAALLLVAVTVISSASSEQCTIDYYASQIPGVPVETQNKVLDIINKARQKLANGEQQNGSGGKNLPKAKGIPDVIWDCDLENGSANNDYYCHNSMPDDPLGRTGLFLMEELYEAIEKWTTAIDTTGLRDSAIGAEDVKYDPTTNDLYEYANLVRENTTKIGCFRVCLGDNNNPIERAYCLTDQVPLTENDAIYTIDPMSRTTTTTTTTTNAATTTSILATTTITKEAITTKTSVATTTEASATTKHSTTETATEESSILATKTTSCIPRRKATTAASSDHPLQSAVFPSSTADWRLEGVTSTLETDQRACSQEDGDCVVGASCSLPAANFVESNGSHKRCPNELRMHDDLRYKFLDMHNYRRAELAKGNIAKKNGNYLPQSSNMQRMRYNCALESNAADYLSTCPSSKLADSSRPNVGENFIRFPQEGLATYMAAAQKAVTSWWKVIRFEEGPGLQVYFRQKHIGTPIESFTQMGWSTSRKLGCAIAKCGSDYLAVCRYSPKGNYVEQVIYEKGTPCTACAAGSWCTEDALCTLP